MIDNKEFKTTNRETLRRVTAKTPTENEGQRLLSLYLNGDEEMLWKLIENYESYLKAVSHSWNITKDQYHDALQELALNLHKNKSLQKYTGERGTISTWLVAVFRNLLTDMFYRGKGAAEKNNNKVPIDTLREMGEMEPATVESEGVYEKILVEELKDKIGKIITFLQKEKTLTPNQVNVLRMNIIEGTGITDIANYLKIPVGTAKNRLHKARNILVNYLKEKFPNLFG